jgi:hypothetical protein
MFDEHEEGSEADGSFLKVLLLLLEPHRRERRQLIFPLIDCAPCIGHAL